MTRRAIETVEQKIDEMMAAGCAFGEWRDALREAIIWGLERSRQICLSVGEDANEAAKAKDATDYVAGYQDAAVDCDEAIRSFIETGEKA